jgi:hypothetical protein
MHKKKFKNEGKSPLGRPRLDGRTVSKLMFSKQDVGCGLESFGSG